MKKAKGKMELRYYDIPQNEFLIALQNQNWQNKYQTEEDGFIFTTCWRSDSACRDMVRCAWKKKPYILRPG